MIHPKNRFHWIMKNNVHSKQPDNQGYMHWMIKVHGCIIKFAFNRTAKVKDLLNIHEVNQFTHSY